MLIKSISAHFMAGFLLLTLSMEAPLYAEEHEQKAAKEAALDLLQIFETETEIATRTKLNADFVPGMVTVLRGEDLEARGISDM